MEKQIMNQLMTKQQQRVLYTDENERACSKDRDVQLQFEKEEFMKKMGQLNKMKQKEKVEIKDNKPGSKVTIGDKAPESQAFVIKQS